MGMRSRIVAGSLSGAVAIHLVMLACSGRGSVMSGRDGGLLDILLPDGDRHDRAAPTDRSDPMDRADPDAPGAMDTAGMDVADDRHEEDRGMMDAITDAVRDVVGEIVDAETRDAHAGGDGGVPTCGCTPPAPTYAFSFLVDSGSGPRPPERLAGSDWARAFVRVAPQPGVVDFPVVYRVEFAADFLAALPPGPVPLQQVRLHCTAQVLPSRSLMPGTVGRCALERTFVFNTLETPAEATPFVDVPTFEVVALTDTTLEVRFARAAFGPGIGGGPAMTLTNFRFSANVPGARFITPPNGIYRAPTP